ncbi:amino acid deaminase [Acidovorax lacteus]|uniref:Amino acid deaminase n=1 Tax=Acidovorax lacteus TaxID=1924988 RepID=A0ABP8LDL7_9BURK
MPLPHPASKGLPATALHAPAPQAPPHDWNLLRGDLPLPLAVLHEEALAHNLRWMQAYARRKGVWLAPHGKTTMSPELFTRQLAAGAWGLTFATAYQASVGVEAGARRIIIANQVVADADFRLLDALLRARNDLRLWFLVDSHAQLALVEEWAEREGQGRVFDVLLELGVAGQRTGCRTHEQAMALAQALRASPHVRLGGVECYEGGLARCDSAHDSAAVSDLVRRAQALVREADAHDLWEDSAVMLSAGGSAVFDLVLPLLQMQGLRRPVQGVLRSGCYITHDHGHYRRLLQQVEQREGLQDSLQPALEVWTHVQSVPEPGLALLTCGRRDISYDIEMPMPLRHLPRGAHNAVEAPASWTIRALNDQHAYLHFDPAAQDAPPAVGDRVVLGLSHPCTTFDKWRWMPVVNAAGDVVDAITTRF